MDHNNKYYLHGEVSVTIRKAAVQSLIRQKLDPSITDEERDKLSFVLTGNIFESPRGINMTLATAFGEEIEQEWKNETYVLDDEKRPGKVIFWSPFKKYSYTIEFKYLYNGKFSEREDTMRGSTLKPISESMYKELVKNLKENEKV